MESLTKLTLDFQRPNYAVTMYAVQNDRLSRKIQATLVDGASGWTPPQGALATVRFSKPDGTSGFYDTDETGATAVTWTGNVATITLAEQALTCAGDVLVQLNFYTATEERLSTFSWKIQVEENALTDDDIVSSDYFNILSAQIAEIMASLDEVPTPYDLNPQMDGTPSSGTSTDYARGDHVHPRDNSRAPTNHASTSTKYGVGSSAHYGHVKLSDIPNHSLNNSQGTAATPKALAEATLFVSGETFSVEGSYLAVSQQTGSVILYIPTPKKIPSNLTVTGIIGVVSIVGNGNQYSGSSSATAYRSSDYLIMVRITSQLVPQGYALVATISGSVTFS